MYGTDRQAIVDLVAPVVGDPGNGALVGPAYAAYYF
jgi:peptide/nickel transport system substrate-binding protein